MDQIILSPERVQGPRGRAKSQDCPGAVGKPGLTCSPATRTTSDSVRMLSLRPGPRRGPSERGEHCSRVLLHLGQPQSDGGRAWPGSGGSSVPSKGAQQNNLLLGLGLTPPSAPKWTETNWIQLKGLEEDYHLIKMYPIFEWKRGMYMIVSYLFSGGGWESSSTSALVTGKYKGLISKFLLSCLEHIKDWHWSLSVEPRDLL